MGGMQFDIDIKGVDRYTKRLLSEIQQAAYRGIKRTVKPVLDDISAALDESFKHAVDDFYNDPNFSPAVYERTYSLYNIMEKSISFDENASEARGSYGFNPANMSTFRNSSEYDNNGLYDQVFRKGWHGGADRVANEKVKYPFQAHPEPGVPYYRRPKPYYKYWGKRASILVPAPLERFNQYINDAIADVTARGNELLKANIMDELSKIKM